MALAKKGTRTITAAGIKFRWVVSPDDEPGMALVVEKAEQPAQRMVTWLDYGSIITPALVGRIITEAITLGWMPMERKRDIVFRLVDGKLLTKPK